MLTLQLWSCGTMFALFAAAALALSSDQVAPAQLRVAYYESFTSMTVFWVTSNVSTPADYAAVALVGTTSGVYTMRFDANSTQNDCFTLSPVKHMAIMSGLAPSTRYYYTVGDARYGMSAEYSFVSKRADNDSSPMRIMTFGDLGIAYANYTLADLASNAAEGSIDWIMHIGDASYADTYISKSTVAGQWYEGMLNEWYSLIEPASRLIPYTIGVGNHEATCNFVEFRTRVLNPNSYSNSTSPFYFSWDVGRTHFVRRWKGLA